MNTFWCEWRALCHIYMNTVLSTTINKYNASTHTHTHRCNRIGSGSAPQSPSCSHCERQLAQCAHTRDLAHNHFDSATDQPKVLIFENDRQCVTAIIQYYVGMWRETKNRMYYTLLARTRHKLNQTLMETKNHMAIHSILCVLWKINCQYHTLINWNDDLPSGFRIVLET